MSAAAALRMPSIAARSIGPRAAAPGTQVQDAGQELREWICAWADAPTSINPPPRTEAAIRIARADVRARREDGEDRNIEAKRLFGRQPNAAFACRCRSFYGNSRSCDDAKNPQSLAQVEMA